MRGVHEVVVVLDEGKYGDGGDDRLGKGQEDLNEDAQAVGTVDFGGVFQFEGDAAEELAHEEDVDGADAAPVGGTIRGSQVSIHCRFLKMRKRGTRVTMSRSIMVARSRLNPEVAARPTDAGEGVGDQRRRDDGAGDCKEDDDQRVDEESRQGQQLKKP